MENSYNYRKRNLDIPRFNIDIQLLDRFCAYVLSENYSIHRNSLQSLRDLLELIGETFFDQNQQCIERYRFILKALSGRLDKNIVNRETLIRDIVGQLSETYEGINPRQFDEITNEEVISLEQTIAACTNLSFINNNIIELSRLTSDYINSDYENKESYALAIKDQVALMQNNFRKNSIESDDLDNTLDLTNTKYILQDLYRDLQRPAYRLRTGMQAFNGIISGGFEGGRVYCLFGLPAEGKTITLLNLAYQIKKFNRDYVCRDKTKIPCIVFLSMENTVKQILETMFNITCSIKPFTDFTQSQAESMIKEFLGVSENDPINIVFRYKPINSVDTSYLYKLVDDLEDEGYEVICLIQDYIKRIRPVDRVKDMRLDLGTIINEFRNFSIYKNIPVITASQFNREGVKTVDEARSGNRHDLVKRIGRHMIGESGLIDENLDCSIFIAKEYVGDKKYMGFHCTKSRAKLYTKVLTFYQPFYDDNPIRYVCDEGASPAYKESLVNDENQIKERFGNTLKLNARREIKTIEDMLNEGNSGMSKDEQENLILGGSLNKIAFNEFVQEEPIKPHIHIFRRINEGS